MLMEEMTKASRLPPAALMLAQPWLPAGTGGAGAAEQELPGWARSGRSREEKVG